MHLVLLSSLVPVENPTSGFDIANRAVLDGLRALGHHVSVVGYLQPGQRPAPGGDMVLLGELEVSNAKVGRATKIAWLTRALLQRTTLSSAKMLATSPARMRAILAELAPFDGLVLNSVQLPGAFLRLLADYPTIYVAHNAEAATARQNAAIAGGRIERALFAREARILDRLEQGLATHALQVFTFCEADRHAFGESVAARASVLPLLRQWQAPSDLPATGTHRRDIGLIGTWSWKANRIGLDWFLDAVVPRLPDDVVIEVAGSLPDAPPIRHPGLRFVGRVADAADFVRASRVVPLVSRGGTGVQLKTIETFEAGMPSVATPSSLRGIDRVPPNCLVADTPEAFAEALVAQVQAVREGRLGPISGHAFHATQKAALLSTLAAGLAAFAREPGRARSAPLHRPGFPTAALSVPDRGLFR
ncbi:glycosyltransferase [Rhizobium sp. YIM 134829]|uniref:glycosyltransferase n=1 Tax=Rhizobium sp. YIM 134829 TaxID=3390453 RepID=UPI00397A6800